jgi:hypothetical protein
MDIENRIEQLDYKRYTGVYLLYKDNELVYAGVACDIYTRLGQHHLNKKVWHTVKYIPEPDYFKAIQIENYFIDTYKPVLNKGSSKLKQHEQINGSKPYPKDKYPGGWN